jgi:hypothetical protein
MANISVVAVLACWPIAASAACVSFGGFGDGECTGPVAELTFFPGDSRLYIRLAGANVQDVCSVGPYIKLDRTFVSNFPDLFQMLLLATATQQTVSMPTFDNGTGGCLAKGGVALIP